ncbi:hypothetical protein I4U23_011583 [Adineta vaga]|nr:hypothetical protein I4U23_011583 [Adineta vaga]
MKHHLKWNGYYFKHQKNFIINLYTTVNSPSIELFLPVNQMKDYLLRQGSITKAQAKRYFTKILPSDKTETSVNYFNEQRYQRHLSTGSRSSGTQSLHISILRMKLLLIICCRHFILGLFSLLISTRTWLFIFIFLICALEKSLVIPSNPRITVFRIIFEVISAFGGCGLSMGFSSTSPGLATALSTSSKIILILVMCMGRHRGLLDSMKDQEEIEYSAQTLIDSWRQLAVYERQQQKQRKNIKIEEDMPTISIKVTAPTPPLSTRF